MTPSPDQADVPAPPEGAGSIQLSVVIPCHNATRTIGQLLEGLCDQTLERSRYEVIVVDDGSTDDTREIIRRFPGVHLLEQNQQGPGVARNLGTRAARGRYVLYLDSDLTVARELLAEHLSALTGDSSIAATGGSVLPMSRLPWLSWLLADHLCSWFNAHPSVRYAEPPEYLPSLNFCIDRRQVVDQAGITWEAGLTHTGEDVLFCHAMRSKGLSLRFLPRGIVYHQDRDTLRGYLTHQYRWGAHAPFVRGRLRDLKFSFLFPSNPWAQLFWLPAIVGGYSALIWKAWLSERPMQATASLPQIILGRIAYAIGVAVGSFRRANQPL